MDFTFNLNLPGEKEKESKAVSLDEKVLYDIFILGGGPAALTAAVYSIRKGLNTALVAKSFGGQVAETLSIENYLGFRYIEGQELVQKFTDQVNQFKVAVQEYITAEHLKIDGDIKEITMSDGNQYRARAVIIATGASWRKLNVPGEAELIGRGVAYCSTCDGPLYANKKVVVVGGGNSGIEAALDLVKIATYVTVVEFADELKADRILIDKLNEYKNFEMYLGHQVEEIIGKEKVTSVKIKDRKTGDFQDIDTDGIFVEIGMSPNSNFAAEVLNLNKQNEILIDYNCKTNIEGIFAAGDVTSVPFNQIIIAAGEGAKAALSAYDYLMKK